MRGRMNLAHGRAAGTPRYRAAYALAFATFAAFSISPLLFLGNHPISVFYFSKHRRTDSYVGAHELGSRPHCWKRLATEPHNDADYWSDRHAALPSRIRACVCYF